MAKAEQEALLKEIDVLGEHLKHLVGKLDARARTQGDVEARCVAVARTELQGGLQWLRRSVLKPDHF
jgi:hypothetical protein